MDQDKIETQEDPVTQETESLEFSPNNDDEDFTEETIEEVNEEAKEDEKVPVKALQDERTKRQALEGQFSELSKRFDRVVEALVANQPKKEEETTEPDFPDWQVDPLGHLKANLAYLKSQIDQLNNGNKAQDQAAQQRSSDNQLHNRWIADISRFSTTSPDVHEAFAFLAKAREAELTELGYTPQEILQNISSDTRDIVSRAYRSGKDPVEILYNQAKKRGFKQGVGTAAKASQKDPRIVRGFDQGGKKVATKVNADTIATMSEEDFEAFMKDKTWKTLHS